MDRPAAPPMFANNRAASRESLDSRSPLEDGRSASHCVHVAFSESTPGPGAGHRLGFKQGREMA
ncbi:hypothetical protein EYF80_022673 [Liparis tanakae]|uniref:Uncharacterized protein n=1 Tax=Liparis tanakae TaxID=230148 RepID=A0A4Z2HQ61_9TELE|nr:hypothetical protein EYF80_022673 [Liparis tanakae]